MKKVSESSVEVFINIKIQNLRKITFFLHSEAIVTVRPICKDNSEKHKKKYLMAGGRYDTLQIPQVRYFLFYTGLPQRWSSQAV
jgi:hypothetical protein